MHALYVFTMMNVPHYSWQTLAQRTWLHILCLSELQMVFRGSPMEPTSQVLCIHRQGIPQCICLDGRAGLFKMHTLNTTMFETDCTGSQSMQRVHASPFASNIIANMWYHNVSFMSTQRGIKWVYCSLNLYLPIVNKVGHSIHKAPHSNLSNTHMQTSPNSHPAFPTKVMTKINKPKLKTNKIQGMLSFPIFFLLLL